MPPNLMAMTDLVHLDLSYNFLEGEILFGWARMRKVTEINLSYNRFTGLFPGLMLDSRLKLQILQLNHNLLTGGLNAVSSMGSLQLLDVSFNNFFGGVSPLLMLSPGL